jgi:hypothetical protein
MEMEMLAEMKADRNTNREEMRTNYEDLLAWLEAKIYASQAKTDINRKAGQEYMQGMLARMNTNQERMIASLREEI